MAGKLAWQAGVQGEAAKATSFRDQTLGLMTFRAFAMMKPKSPVIYLVHSMGKFFGLSGMSPDLQDKQIGFVGDRNARMSPTPILLPPTYTWSWAKPRALMNTARFGQFYSDDDNQNRLWTTGAADEDLTEVCLPRMLAPPGFLVDRVVQEGCCLPHQFRQIIKDHVDGGASQLDGAAWQLVLDWCLAASQTNTNGNSLMQLLTIEPVISQDPEFLE